MPGRFSQYLAFELPKQAKFVSRNVKREEYDVFSLEELLQYFNAYLQTNFAFALVGERRTSLQQTLAKVKTRFTQPISDYDAQPDKPAPNVWDVLTKPTPREALVKELDKLADDIAEEWQATLKATVTDPGKLTQKVRPLEAGHSVGVQNNPRSGTIGAFLRSKGKVYLLSNAHILTQNAFNDKDQSPIVQPSMTDGGMEVVANTAHHFPIVGGAINPMDAAIACVRDDVNISLEYPHIGELTGFREAKTGETLRMACRSSGFIQAIVTRVVQEWPVRNWVVNGGARIKFGPVLELRASTTIFTNLEGDSGGLWIGEDNKAVALNFSGGEESTYAGAIPITTVIAYMQKALNDGQAGLIGVENSTLYRPT